MLMLVKISGKINFRLENAKEFLPYKLMVIASSFYNISAYKVFHSSFLHSESGECLYSELKRRNYPN